MKSTGVPFFGCEIDFDFAFHFFMRIKFNRFLF